MVTELRSSLIGRIVRIDLFLLQHIGLKVKAEEFLFECRGRVISTEDFGR